MKLLPLNEPVNIPVHITDMDTGGNIGGVHVILRNTTNLDCFDCTTGSAGGCTLYNVPPGQYEYTIYKETYSEERGIIEISFGSTIEESLKQET